MYFLITLFLLYSLAFYFWNKTPFFWNCFTRFISTLNSIQCIYFSIYILFTESQIFQLYYSTNNVSFLYRFSNYLLVDGLFHLILFYINPKSQKLSDLTFVIHHFIGSLGIFFIANENKGIFLGCYFAFTELSTPLLHLSWLIRHQKIFKIFYFAFFTCRLLTAPLLSLYLFLNRHEINQLPLIHYVMVYYGSICIFLLNCIWFIYLTQKYRN
jgi:hypothetical protein